MAVANEIADGAATSSLSERIRFEQIEIMFRTGPPALVGALFAAAMLVGVFNYLFGVDARAGALWLGAQVLVFCSLQLVATLYWRARRRGEDWRIWLRAFCLLVFVGGLIWSLGTPSLYTQGDVQQELFVVLFICALASGTVLALGSYLPATYLHLFALTMAQFYWLATRRDAMHTVLSVLDLSFVGGISLVCWVSNRNIAETIRLRLEKTDLAEHLREQTQVAVAASLAKSRILASASHDLRQPVHALGMFAEALREQPLNADSRRLVEQIRASVSSMDTLFSTLLDISRLDAGVVQPRFESFAIGPLLTNICNDCAAEAERKGLRLVACRSSAYVRSDPALLGSVLRNLLCNAVRYTDRGRVLIGCRRGSGCIRVEVLDTGPGVSDEFREKIFEEFFQVGNPERDRSKGLGLGLAIVKRLTTLLGCKVEIRSQPGRGTRAIVSIPLAAAGDEAPTSSAAAAPSFDRTGLILVIDDERAVRRSMQSALTSWGHRVIVASDGAQMLRFLETSAQTPDLIICDFRLPGGEDGTQVVKRLQQEYNQEIPAILVTGDTAPERLREAAASGIALLHKPVSGDALRKAIGEALDNPAVAKV